jgi:NRAMP (natural resistance-associated macrophage protein)-like metal ion transporter
MKRVAITVRDKIRAGLHALGPGLVTGAADDDPSGIATYSQAGAQYGFGMLWTMPLSAPFMIAIQLASARIGRVTGIGLAGNLRLHYPRPLVLALVTLLVVANVINITADLAAMGEAMHLVVGGGQHRHTLVYGLLLVGLQVWVPYYRLAEIFKWLCLSLLAYFFVLLYVNLEWRQVFLGLVWPQVAFNFDSVMMVVAVLGTTISPYLFFWQASHEVEEMRSRRMLPLAQAPELADRELLRIRFDTAGGMAFSNLIALAIMLAAAATLHAHGVTEIKTAAQAADALRPIAGSQAFLLFALGIVSTGLLAVPILAGSAAYAVSEVFRWGGGLAHTWQEARGFYTIVIACTIAGTLLDLLSLDPIKALLYSAVINGMISVPIMVMIVMLAANRKALGDFAIKGPLLWANWLGTLLMAVAVGLMLYAAAA